MAIIKSGQTKRRKNKKKYRFGVVAFFVVNLLFFLAVVFLYTPWVQKSRVMQIYKIKRILKDIPATHPLYIRYQAILRCLQENICDYSFESNGLPPVAQ